MLDPDSTSAPSSMPPPVTPTLVRRECHIALWRRRPFTEGEEVFVTNPSDGVLYFGIVVEVDEDVLQCLVRFGDCTERWSNFWDVRRIGESEPSEGQKWMQQKLQKEREERIRKIQERHRERMRREQEQLTRLSSYEEEPVEAIEVDHDDDNENDNTTNDEDFDDEPEFVDGDDDEEDEDEMEEDDDEFDDGDDYNEDPDFKSAVALKNGRPSAIKVPMKRKIRAVQQIAKRPRKKLKPRETSRHRPRPPTPERVKVARKELPYEFDSLVWNENHTRNDREMFCYCGENGDWYRRMLQCQTCLQWFHQECLRTSTEQMLFGDRFFDFTCALCGPLSKATNSGVEMLARTDMSYVEALHLVLFHLTVMNSKKFHDVENSVVPFFRRRVKQMQGPACRLKLSRVESGSILNLLAGNKGRFKCGSELRRRNPFWGLRKVAPPSPANSSNFKCNSKDLVSIGSKKRPVSAAMPPDRNGRGARRRPGRPPGRGGGKRGRGGARGGGGLGDSLENSECNSDDTSSHGTLDSFIPPPKDFEGTNNPFRDLGLFGALEVPTLSKTGNGSYAGGGGMLMMGCRVGRKPGDIRVNKTEYSSSIGVANNGDQNGGDKENDCSEGGGGKDNKLLTDLKYSLNSYFGAETRITKGGERFQVAAKRLAESGDVQHLIEWEKPNPLSPPILSQSAHVPQTTVEAIKSEAANNTPSATGNGSNSDSGIASPTNSISSSSSTLATSKTIFSAATAVEPHEFSSDPPTSATLRECRKIMCLVTIGDQRYFLCDPNTA